MNRIIIFSVFFVLSNVVLGQSSFDLGLGYCRYSNNYNDYIRIDGATFHVGYEYKLNETFSIRTGLDANVSRENYNYSYYRRYIDPETGDYSLIALYTDKSDNYSVNIQWPVSIAARLFKSDFSLIAGLNFGLDNLFIFGDAFAGSDPEISYYTSSGYYGKDWPISRKFSFGHHVGMHYQPLDRFIIYLEFKTLKNKEFGFNSIGIGLRYRICKG